MKKNLTFFLLFAIPLFCMAQNPLPREYYYDAAGNRTLRKVIEFPLLTPSLPEDTTDNTQTPPNNSEETLTTLTSLESFESAPPASPYFFETLAQTSIKIYPNPTTEKVTLEISGWETLQTGVFKLNPLTGQLLQEQPVHSLTTTISLAGLSKGAYILKVQINSHLEDWKVIKN